MTARELAIKLLQNSDHLDAEIEVAVMDANNDGLFSEIKLGMDVYYDPDGDILRIVGNTDKEMMTKEGVKNYISDLIDRDIHS